jgi:hypothetical protein
VISTVENLATARNDESIDPNPTAVRRPEGRDRTPRAPEMRNRTAIEHLAVTTETTATLEVLNVGPDRAVPVETVETRDGRPRVTIEPLVATTRDLLATVASTKSRHRDPTIVALARRSALGRHARRVASIRIRAIVGRVCRRETARPLEHASNDDLAN